MKISVVVIGSCLALLSGCYSARAQVNVRDSAVFAPMFYAHYMYQMPGGDLATRFGNNSNVGGGFQIKSRSNWIYGIEFQYLFGDKVKNSESILSNLAEEGQILDGNGAYAEVFYYERGFLAQAKGGKIFPVLRPNPNSGPCIMLGKGLLQHKIRIENPGNVAPQIKGDYKKGYDQLTNGLALTEFIGYMYMGNRRLVTFFAGIEFTQAWTQNRRDYDFALMKKDDTKRLDLLYGLKLGWVIPLYKRSPSGYYYHPTD